MGETKTSKSQTLSSASAGLEPMSRSVTDTRIAGGGIMSKRNLVIEEGSVEALARLQKQDEEFCRRLRAAIETGHECCPTIVLTEPCTKRPVSNYVRPYCSAAMGPTRARSAPIESGGFSWDQGWESLSALIRFWGAGMPKAYSGEMRERVIAEVESGATRREAAEEFAVSASTAVIWVKCFRQTGRCAAKPRGGSISPLEKHANFLLGLIEKQPD